MDKRVKAKLEQEEKIKKAVEEKAQRQKILDRQNEAREKISQEMQEALMKSEKLRQDEIRERGWDRLEMCVKDLRKIPENMYDTEEARRRLSYLVIIATSMGYLIQTSYIHFIGAQMTYYKRTLMFN